MEVSDQLHAQARFSTWERPPTPNGLNVLWAPHARLNAVADSNISVKCHGIGHWSPGI
jgi:hypothetical protein